jgi:hypothetical protein
MKKTKLIYIAVATTLFVGACKQENIKLAPPAKVEPPVVVTPSKGTADFTKFIALGDSYTAGLQGGALFNEGQSNSVAKIMATQFAAVGGGVFNQPDINSVNGFNSSSSNPAGGVIRGRLVLFDPDGATDPDGAGCQVSRSASPRAAGSLLSEVTCPSAVTTPAMPAPYNTADLPAAYSGDKLTLNNFSVPGTRIFHTTAGAFGTPVTGNPYYSRFATAPGTSQLLIDAASKQGSFFMLYVGNFDILSYATAGAAGNPNGTGSVDMTPESAVFAPSYAPNLNAFLATPNSKGVVGNIPDITSLPFFFTVTWNNIEFKTTDCKAAETLAQLNGLTAFGGYNAALDGLAVAGAITTAEAAKRKVSYAYGKNGILIADKTLANLTAALSGINPALGAYGQVRQATASDLITLSAGAVLGTCAIPPGGTTPSASYITGVSAPLGDQYVLLPTEIADIKARTTAFNTIIKNAVDASGDRVALADINTAYATLATNKAAVVDGITITPTLAPPTGIFSEDGLHPNSRGAAYTANIFISAINAKFGATIAKVNLATFKGTGLPVNP